MTENKGDLISRDALKKALKSNCTPELCHDYNTSWCERCCRTNDFEDLIDNAPTVEANSIIDGLNNEIDDLSENLAWYINERNRLLKERRPQGEWQTQYETVCEFKYEVNNKACSNCGHTTKFKFPHCPWCGADMRGKE